MQVALQTVLIACNQMKRMNHLCLCEQKPPLPPHLQHRSGSFECAKHCPSGPGTRLSALLVLLHLIFPQNPGKYYSLFIRWENYQLKRVWSPRHIQPGRGIDAIQRSRSELSAILLSSHSKAPILVLIIMASWRHYKSKDKLGTYFLYWIE